MVSGKQGLAHGFKPRLRSVICRVSELYSRNWGVYNCVSRPSLQSLSVHCTTPRFPHVQRLGILNKFLKCNQN